jgi:chromosome segregation ATPase
MTNEEMQKTMEFILEHQAQFAVNIQRLQEERLRDHPRLTRLEESFQLLVELAQSSDARLDAIESTTDARFDALESNIVRDHQRLTQLEESFQLLVHLAQTTDTRLDTVESNTVGDRARLTQLEESFQLLVQLAQTTNTRFGALESNIGTLESNMAALAVAQAHSEEKLGALIDIVRKGQNGKS